MILQAKQPAKAINKLGKTTEITKTINFTSDGPIWKVDPIPSTTTQKSLTVSWSVTDNNDASPKVYINDKLMSSYNTSADVNLAVGLNTFKLVASNSYGKTTETIYTVTYIPGS